MLDPRPAVIFLFAAATSLAITPMVRRFAVRTGTVDKPSARKNHREPMPLLGGIAVAVALALAIAVALALGWLPGAYIKGKFAYGMLAAIALLVVGGALDDKYDLSPVKQLFWPFAASLAIVASGIGVDYVTNPFGGQLHLDRYVFTALWADGIPYKVTLVADVFTVAWLMTMTYTTKFLDGLDGLVSGTAVIGAVVIAFVSLTREVSQPDTALLAFAVAGAFLGFLRHNAHPAKIFLGEGGSTLAGFLLGTLAIVAGGKIATALLVLGLPFFDAAFVILRRLFWERRSPTSADRTHLHLRLLDLGFTHRQVVLFYWFVTALFGASTLILQGWEKVAAIGLLASILAAATAVGVILYQRPKQ
jgi:UDP-GlcNAc:undecaprenyl-phosphate GlcNAc-1-phosphate transferase